MEKTELQIYRKELGDILRSNHVLEEKYSYYLGDVHDRLEKWANEASKRYAKAVCRSLCDKFRARLPRELRDIVYLHLIDTNKIRIQDGAFRSSNMTPESYFKDPGCYNYLDRIHYWNVKYVGREFLYELAETWYRVSTFDFGHRLFNIRRFLEEDRWGLGLKPQALASKMSLLLVDQENSGIEAGSMEQLMELFKWRKGSQLHVRLVSSYNTGLWGWTDDKILQFLSLHRALFQILQELKSAGYHVLATVDGVPIAEHIDLSTEG